VTFARWTVIAGILLLALTAPGAAQQIPLDSVPPDSLIDTVNTTARYLKAQEAQSVRLPVLPQAGFDGPLPPGSRIILDRDSLDWALAETVGDLRRTIVGAGRPRWSITSMACRMSPSAPTASRSIPPSFR
jgi:hypothetical protein